MIVISYIIRALENIVVCYSQTINSTFKDLVTIMVLLCLVHKLALRSPESVLLTRVLSTRQLLVRETSVYESFTPLPFTIFVPFNLHRINIELVVNVSSIW